MVTIEQGAYDLVRHMYHLYADDGRYISTISTSSFADFEASIDQLKRIRHPSIFKTEPAFKWHKRIVPRILLTISRFRCGLWWAEAIVNFLRKNFSPDFFQVVPFPHVGFSSLASDRTWAPICFKHTVLATGPPGESS